MPKNVTPNCAMLELILVYFKGIYQEFDDLEENIGLDCVARQIKVDSEIGGLVRGKVAEMDVENPMRRIFGLKDVRECENEENI